MNNTTHQQGDGPSHRWTEISVGAIIALLGLITIIGSLKVGIGWGAEGPKSGFFPFYLGVTIILASVLNLVAAATESSQKVFADWSQLVSVVSVVIPTTIYVFAVPWTGIYLASLILIAVFMKWLGRYSIAMCAAVSVGVVVATYLMFEKWFLVPLPKGPIEDWLGL